MPETKIRHIGHIPMPIVGDLIKALREYTLDPTFERFWNFIIDLGQEDPARPSYRPGWTHVWGNFADVSLVFSIDTNDPAVIGELTAAIRANQATPAYVKAKEEQAARDAFWREQHERTERLRRDDALRQLQAMGGLPALAVKTHTTPVQPDLFGGSNV